MADLIRIRPGEKVLVLGQNGTGKSVFATSIARAWANGPVLIVDPKGDDAEAVIPNAAIAHTAADAMRRWPGRVVYRPTLAELVGRHAGDPPARPPIWARLDELCRRIYDGAGRGEGPTLVVIHEFADFCTAVSSGPALAQLIRSGRSKGITLVLVTQRPQGTLVAARSEAQHVVAFTLTDQAARDVAADLMSDVDDPALAALVRGRALPLDRRWWYRGPDFRLRLHDPLPYRRD